VVAFSHLWQKACHISVLSQIFKNIDACFNGYCCDLLRRIFFAINFHLLTVQFLADRTRLCYSVASVCRHQSSSVRNVLWIDGASYSKSYYWQPVGSHVWEIVWYQNEWPWPLFRGHIKVKGIALHLTLNILETVRDRGLSSKGPPIGNGIIFFYYYGLSNDAMVDMW